MAYGISPYATAPYATGAVANVVVAVAEGSGAGLGTVAGRVIDPMNLVLTIDGATAQLSWDESPLLV